MGAFSGGKVEGRKFHGGPLKVQLQKRCLIQILRDKKGARDEPGFSLIFKSESKNKRLILPRRVDR